MHISSGFDAGNIRVLSQQDPNDICLEIVADHQSDFYQWFHFRVAGVRGASRTYRIVNAAGAAYPGGFENYRVLYSYDRETWRRHPTTLQDGVLSWTFTAERDSVHFAYFVPYPMARHHDLIARFQTHPLVRLECLGTTLDGQDLDLLHIEDSSITGPKKACWIIARQHPGETMAEWFMEGILERLVDEEDVLVKALLRSCRFHLVPNMNPDGSRRGHLRTNAAGRNLNREWSDPSLTHSPEVFLVKHAMRRTGVDFLLDVHGDETLPYCFIAGTEGLPNWDATRQARLDSYKAALARFSPDFQTEVGYAPKAPGEANMGMSTSAVAAEFDCLAMTLEMPFKDTTATPDPEFGWSPQRSRRLADDCLAALRAYWLANLP